ncbi:hypothetical protein P175DRAFT_0435454 [Aspergillus ochraceoroseus IBT 24754]|uniref:Uncharacterized protein n=3 Tax=Aspergillus subgen. Nidulantes TaxID=2720870 RepID=A0A0F8WCV1_9EURO|nr:uncharacterized protein P175DRAFT_0435454 [Aspergillus ochraceoroseus IBT 24754]KKK15685.1 hypothetical protein ARAM_006618 [Aspergillus rambellii]KKK17323.1 hypothetical protein AOCH_002449 [Aspergillus ochraceoroseus]PTU21369.1 hypothetical protein P175DRAFT_0435454 [Aspergillus ochraceoroseus IBT 24754]
MSTPFTLYTARDRPDLLRALDEPDHPLNLPWPEFLDQDLTFQLFSSKLTRFESLAHFQFLAVERDAATDEEHVVGLARSIPFFWPEVAALDLSSGTDSLSRHPKILSTLPDGGYDTMLARGVHQYLAREGRLLEPLALTADQESDSATARRRDPPNALSALSITVRCDRRRMGLAEAFIAQMKQTAIEQGLLALVVPLRPTRKAEHPQVNICDYIRWPVGEGLPPTGHVLEQSKPSLSLLGSANLPFDPWLRKHLRLGGKIVKVAQSSMIVHGTDVQWHRWTNIDFEQVGHPSSECLKSKEQDYVDVVIPAGLVPVRYYYEKRIGVYREPNVWVFHELKSNRH